MKAGSLCAIACTTLLGACVYHEIRRSPDCLETAIQVDLRTVQGTSCAEADGIIAVEVQAASFTYTTYLNGRAIGGSRTQTDIIEFSELTAGSYLVQAIDSRGCADSLRVFVPDLTSTLAVNVTTEPDNACLASNGSVSISVEGGTSPYNVWLDDRAVLPHSSGAVWFVGELEARAYSVRVEDARSCSQEVGVMVPRAVTGLGWSADIKPIMDTYCAKSGCHAGDTGRADFSVYDNVKVYAAQIRTRVQNRSMPFDGPLPDAYIQMLTCWIDDGAPPN